MQIYKIVAEEIITHAIWICAKNAKEAIIEAQKIDKSDFCDMSDEEPNKWIVLNSAKKDNSNEYEYYKEYVQKTVDEIFDFTDGDKK